MNLVQKLTKNQLMFLSTRDFSVSPFPTFLFSCIFSYIISQESSEKILFFSMVD